MTSAQPFADFNPRPSAWGYNWTAAGQGTAPAASVVTQAIANHCPTPSPEPRLLAMSEQQLANMPAALLGTLKRDKKPFTYTPGGVNLSEVLNARLQKRLDRKKKYTEARIEENAPPIRFDPPPKQVVVMPTYNSPLDMYSMENALEALEVQAELVAADRSLSASSRSATLPRNHTFRFEDKDLDPGKGVAQSKAFRVLQIITDTEEEMTEKSRPQHHDEMRFTGIRDSKAIPSKFFHTLQKITGTEEEDEGEELQQRVGVARPPALFEKCPGPRTSFPPQQRMDGVRQQQPPPVDSVRQQPFGSATTLRRPAAFLPIKTGGCGFRSVHPPSAVSNGPARKGLGNNPIDGTDF